MAPPPAIITGQQIGAGWTPALSVVKALTALAEARRTGARALYWLADEDHDRHEVAATCGLQAGRLLRHRFRFAAPPGTATGWLPWEAQQQREAEQLWGQVPLPQSPDLRGHALALGRPLWELGLEPFSPTDPAVRMPIQSELERWRSLGLEADLAAQAERLAAEGAPLPLDPSAQAAWFSLDPATGLRQRLEQGEPCSRGCWLSPGAALRPLMQSLLVPVEGMVLGPAERAYWRLTEPLWERVGLQPPRIIPRPTVHLLPPGLDLELSDLERIRLGDWTALALDSPPLPSQTLPLPTPDPAWAPPLAERFRHELERTRARLGRLDRRVLRDAAAARLGMDPERLRQALFPFGRPQERVLPGIQWLREPELLQCILAGLETGAPVLTIPHQQPG